MITARNSTDATSQARLAVTGVLALAALAAPLGAQTVCWQGSSNVLPDDPVVPQQHRFDIAGSSQDVSLANGLLTVVDPTDASAVSLSRAAPSPIALDDEWEFVLEIQMRSASRSWGVPLGNQSTVADASHRYSLGVDDDGVGFVDSPSTDWVDGLFLPMDVSDQLHRFRVIATATTIELYVDGSTTASLTIPKASFPASSGGSTISLLSTSIVAVADFDVSECRFSHIGSGLALSACAPVVSPGDTLAFAAVGGVPGSLNALYLSSVNGTPFFYKILFGNFDAGGTWGLDATVPPGLGGTDFGFVLFGFDGSTGQLRQSDESHVAFL